MAYKDFTLDDLAERFGVTNRIGTLFPALPPLEVSPALRDALDTAQELRLVSEKAKCEAVVFPMLVDLRKSNGKFFMIHSGESLNADAKRGLKGECDFILAKDTQSLTINAPIMQIVEAKRNDFDIGIPQCAAQLLGAQIFNEKKGTPLDAVYGCVTTLNDWIFMRLEGSEIVVHKRTYFLAEIGEILAVFQHILDKYKHLYP